MIEPCDACGVPTGLTLGAVAMCEACRHEALAPIRAHVIARYGAVDVIHRAPVSNEGAAPAHGAGFYWLRCDVCGAGWVGPLGAECTWCIERLEAQRESERANLLHPSWLIPSHSSRYDELDDIDKRIWDRTRGQLSGTESEAEWVRRLKRAVDSGLITQSDARNAMRRMERAWHAT